MVDFWVYDVVFLAVFVAFISWFLYSRRKNLKREGIIFMYRTKVGIKLINYFGTKFKKFLSALKYLIIVIGFGLMASMIYLLWDVVYKYVTNADLIVSVVKAPPIAPLIPYFPKLFGLESFFPPFYFTYFLLALAVVAIVHEFSHGIFMKLSGIKIKSTGIVFLGPILGAFVEEDKNSFVKKKKVDQMAVLGAGTFANVVTALVFYLLLVGFFFTMFVPGGYVFNTYATTAINADSIDSFGEEMNYTVAFVEGQKYFLDENMVRQLDYNLSQIVVYDDTPAFRSQMVGAIVEADGVDINTVDNLVAFLDEKNPGDKINITTKVSADEFNIYEIVLDEHPVVEGRGYIGVGFANSEPDGIVQKTLYKFFNFKEPATNYEPRFDGNFPEFVYNFLWWVMVINILVALFNMLPVGILDGGRFLYLGLWGVTSSERFARFIYKAFGWLILAAFVLITLIWLVKII